MTIKLKKLPTALRASLDRIAPPNAGHRVPGRMEVIAAGDDTVELLIYGNIGDSWWDESVTAKEVVEQLRDTTASRIVVRINSYGGSVTDGIAIYNALRAKARAGVTVDGQVDAMAASIASLIAMACDKLVMPETSRLMLHAPWGSLYFSGNAKELREVSDEYVAILQSYGAAMALAYARKTGKEASEFEAMWDGGKDHYYTAAAAVEFGLADEVLDSAEQTDDEDAVAFAASTADAALQRLIARAPQDAISALFAATRCPTPTAAPARPAATPLLPASAGAPPADADTLTGAIPMTEEEKKALAANQALEAKAKAAADAAVNAAIAGLQARNTEIRAIAEPHFGNAEVKAYVEGVIGAADPGVGAQDVGKQVLALLAKGREPLNGGGNVHAGADERDKQRGAMGKAIEARVGTAKAEAGNPFHGFTMFELARACAEKAGVNTRGMDRMDVVANAFTHSSSDFPLLLGDTARKALKRGYEEAAEVFPAFTRAVTLTDFKATSLAGLGRFSNLDLIPENGEYKSGTFNESGSSLKLATYGKMFGISRQAIINDDLNALSDVPRKMGQSAKRAVGNAVFSVITNNPLLPDGAALFSTQHNNLVNPGTVISTTSVDGMRVLMALQKDADGNVVRVPLRYLIVPVGLGGLARTVLESQFEVSATKNNSTPNIVRNTFEVVEDPRLDAASPTAWYGVADPAMFDGIVVGYLDGKQEPYLEAKEGWSVDGTQWKVRMDAAAAVADPTALAKNPGA